MDFVQSSPINNTSILCNNVTKSVFDNSLLWHNRLDIHVTLVCLVFLKHCIYLLYLLFLFVILANLVRCIRQISHLLYIILLVPLMWFIWMSGFQLLLFQWMVVSFVLLLLMILQGIRGYPLTAKYKMISYVKDFFTLIERKFKRLRWYKVIWVVNLCCWEVGVPSKG